MRIQVFLALAILGGVAVHSAPRRQSPALAAFGSRNGKREVSRVKRTRNTFRRFRKRLQPRMPVVPLDVFDQALTLTTPAPEIVPSSVPSKEIIPKEVVANEIVPVEKKPLRFIPMVELEQQQSYSQIWQKATSFLANNPYFLHWLASLGDQPLKPATSQQEKIAIANKQLGVIQKKKVNLHEILTSSDNQPKSLFIKTDLSAENNINQIKVNTKAKSLATIETEAETHEETIPAIPEINIPAIPELNIPVIEIPIENEIVEEPVPEEELEVNIDAVSVPQTIMIKDDVAEDTKIGKSEILAFDSIGEKAPEHDSKSVVDLIPESQPIESDSMVIKAEEKIDLVQEKTPIVEEAVEIKTTESPILFEKQTETPEIKDPVILENVEISKDPEPSVTPAISVTAKISEIPVIPKIPEIPPIPQIPILKIINNIRRIPEMFKIPKSIESRRFHNPLVTTDVPKTTEELKLVTEIPVTQDPIQEKVDSTTILAEIKLVEPSSPIKEEIELVSVTPKSESESPLPLESSSSTALPQIEESTTEVIPEEKVPEIIPEVKIVPEKEPVKEIVTKENLETIIKKTEIPEAKPILIKKKVATPIKVKQPKLPKKVEIRKQISKPLPPKVDRRPLPQVKTPKSLQPVNFDSAFSLTPFKFPSFSYSIRHIPNQRNYFGR